MSKKYLLLFSFFLAIGILYFTKTPKNKLAIENKQSFQTFEKNIERKVASHESTEDELKKANINADLTEKNITKKRNNIIAEKKIPIRQKRVLIGDNIDYFQEEGNELEMLNTPNSEWKKLLGNDLLSFQTEETKVIVKEEFPLIKIIDNKGMYLEQVVITFLLKNGNQNSFRAYVDSETGKVIETWDQTIHEKTHQKRPALNPVPMDGVTAK